MICNCYKHTGPESPAISKLTCSECGKEFGRCEACLNLSGNLKNSMELHWKTVHARFTRKRLAMMNHPGRGME